MMDKIKRPDWTYTLGSLIASVAVIITAFNVNTYCYWIAHQDELPENSKKLRKF